MNCFLQGGEDSCVRQAVCSTLVTMMEISWSRYSRPFYTTTMAVIQISNTHDRNSRPSWMTRTDIISPGSSTDLTALASS
jgi:hypothetical protein